MGIASGVLVGRFNLSANASWLLNRAAISETIQEPLRKPTTPKRRSPRSEEFDENLHPRLGVQNLELHRGKIAGQTYYKQYVINAIAISKSQTSKTTTFQSEKGTNHSPNSCYLLGIRQWIPGSGERKLLTQSVNLIKRICAICTCAQSLSLSSSGKVFLQSLSPCLVSLRQSPPRQSLCVVIHTFKGWAGAESASLAAAALAARASDCHVKFVQKCCTQKFVQ